MPHFAFQAAFGALAIIHLDRAGNSVTVRFQCFKTLPHDGKDLVPFSFQRGAHGVQTIIQPAGRNNLQAPRHVRCDAFAFAHGRHAEIEEDHECNIPFIVSRPEDGFIRNIRRRGRNDKHKHDHFSSNNSATSFSTSAGRTMESSVPPNLVHLPWRLKTYTHGMVRKRSLSSTSFCGSSRITFGMLEPNFSKSLRTRPFICAGVSSFAGLSKLTEMLTRPSLPNFFCVSSMCGKLRMQGGQPVDQKSTTTTLPRFFRTISCNSGYLISWTETPFSCPELRSPARNNQRLASRIKV